MSEKLLNFIFGAFIYKSLCWLGPDSQYLAVSWLFSFLSCPFSSCFMTDVPRLLHIYREGMTFWVQSKMKPTHLKSSTVFVLMQSDKWDSRIQNWHSSVRADYTLIISWYRTLKTWQKFPSERMCWRVTHSLWKAQVENNSLSFFFTVRNDWNPELELLNICMNPVIWAHTLLKK